MKRFIPVTAIIVLLLSGTIQASAFSDCAGLATVARTEP